MTLPAPNLDDRTFQRLVDDAKQIVRQKCEGWTDHNVSDPGVTFIETVAFMVDQLIYRLNRVPELNYVKFLELIGVQLFPPAAAHADVTFWLSAPQPTTVITIAPGTRVATVRTEHEEAITFSATEELPIVPSSLLHLISTIDGGATFRNHIKDIEFEEGEGFYCFETPPTPPKPNDALLIGLPNAVPSCAIRLEFECPIQGHGINPKKPPWVWEACTNESPEEPWTECAWVDGTGGFNKPGKVIVHVPRGHQAVRIGGHLAGWIRCRVTEAKEEGQRAYSESPKIRHVEAATIGGTADTVNAELVKNEHLGTSDGSPGQRFALKHAPVVRSTEPTVLLVTPQNVSNGPHGAENAASGDVSEPADVAVKMEEAPQEWIEVTDFANSGPKDRHFILDPFYGEVRLGPAVREKDGNPRQFGDIPPKGADLRISAYRTGGGKRGNVLAHQIRKLKSPIPFVAEEVVNRDPATGGVDAEDIENAKLRGPLLMRARGRAVTAGDYEALAIEALARQDAHRAARVKCFAAGEGADAGSVLLLVVPEVEPDELGRFPSKQLEVEEEYKQLIEVPLEERRPIGVKVVVRPPDYKGVSVGARIRARPGANAQLLKVAAEKALYGYFNPVSGGPDGRGWPFGRPVLAGDVYSVLHKVPGVEFVEKALMYEEDPDKRPVDGSGDKSKPRIDLGPHELVYSFAHEVEIVE